MKKRLSKKQKEVIDLLTNDPYNELRVNERGQWFVNNWVTEVKIPVHKHTLEALLDKGLITATAYGLKK